MVDTVAAEVASIVLLARLDPEAVSVCVTSSPEAEGAAAEQGNVQLVAEGGTEIYIPKSGLVDAEKEIARLVKQREKLGKEVEKLEKRINSPGFADKAPPAVVDKARSELQDLVAQSEKVADSLKSLAV